MTSNAHSPMLQPTLLSIGLLTVIAGAAVAPALGGIAGAFPETGVTAVKLVITLPSLLIIPFSLISGRLCERFDKRRMLLLGLGLFTAGGVGGGFAPDFATLLVLRAVLGAGVGLINPISISLVADFYTDAARARVMGRLSAANYLGGILALLMSGWLAAIDWRFSFFVYLAGLLVCGLVYLFLPRAKPKSPRMAAVQTTGKLPLAVYMYAGAAFLLMTAFFVIPTTMALLMEDSGIGGAREAGLVIAATSAAGFLAGIFFKKTHAWLGQWLVPSQIILMAIGFFLLAEAGSMVELATGTAAFGFGMGSLMPFFLVRVSATAPPENTVKAMAIVTSMVFLGQFLSPLLLRGIGEAFGDPSIVFSYRFLAIATAMISATAFLWTFWVSIRAGRPRSSGEAGRGDSAGITPSRRGS